MKRKYNIHMPEYTFDQAKVDAEVKKIIEQKELEAIPLGKVCVLLHRKHEEIQRILGRRYKDKHGGILYR